MAAGLHGSARTTPRLRAEPQAAQGATGALAARYGLNPRPPPSSASAPPLGYLSPAHFEEVNTREAA